MELKLIRDWLIQNGISASELDDIKESPVIRDIGEGLTLSLINDEEIGNMLIMLMMRVDELESRITTLEGGN